MDITVEFTGLVRSLANEKSIRLNLPAGATYRDVIRILADKYPELVGMVITSQQDDLLNANILSRNGEDMILGERMDECPTDGDRLLLLSIIVGGSLG
ncbi:MAG: MoaD/ThiS family protein [Anaerolineaceae bacterium]|nr:MoaD/ThiS family protein [Anaerolineaceae bacterium]